MIKIAAIHPSYGRPSMAFQTYREWITMCNNPSEVEYIIGLDDNDPSVEEYRTLFRSESMLPARFGLNVANSRNTIAAMNAAAKIMSPTTELIISIGDDMAPCRNWDTTLLGLLDGVDNFTIPRFIGVSDGLRSYGVFVYLIVNRAWYTRLGYLLCPDYDGVFVDNDMQEVAKRLNCIIDAPHIVFQHRHYSIGLNAFDATYARNNNAEGTMRNLDIYSERVKRNFDL